MVFITRKLNSCLPTLISTFDRDLKSYVLIEIKSNGCGSIYVVQTSRHVITRITEHQKEDSQVGRHIVECSGSTNNILDVGPTVEKRITIEAIYDSKLKPRLNTRWIQGTGTQAKIFQIIILTSERIGQKYCAWQNEICKTSIRGILRVREKLKLTYKTLRAWLQ